MNKQDPMFAAVRDFARRALVNPTVFEWTVQGFGMLRCYLQPDKRFRLNVWDRRLRVPYVSTIHDHPWHLQSWVLAGTMENVRFYENERPDSFGAQYHWMDIATGIEAQEQPTKYESAWLWQGPIETYEVGDTYKQFATEIHVSVPLDGCVTINDRERVGTGDRARVYWPQGQRWVDAKPRLATPKEVFDTCALALEGWN